MCYISFDLFVVIVSMYRYKNEKQNNLCVCKNSFRRSVGISLQELIFQEIILELLITYFIKQPSSSVLRKYAANLQENTGAKV